MQSVRKADTIWCDETILMKMNVAVFCEINLTFQDESVVATGRHIYYTSHLLSHLKDQKVTKESWDLLTPPMN